MDGIGTERPLQSLLVARDVALATVVDALENRVQASAEAGGPAARSSAPPPRPTTPATPVLTAVLAEAVSAVNTGAGLPMLEDGARAAPSTARHLVATDRSAKRPAAGLYTSDAASKRPHLADHVHS